MTTETTALVCPSCGNNAQPSLQLQANCLMRGAKRYGLRLAIHCDACGADHVVLVPQSSVIGPDWNQQEQTMRLRAADTTASNLEGLASAIDALCDRLENLENLKK